MAEEPDDLVLPILRAMRADMSRIDETLREVRRTVMSHDLRFDALDEKFEIIREGTVSAIGYAANGSRAHVDLQRQIADLARRVEKLEAAK
jgi:hypothetical protein